MEEFGKRMAIQFVTGGKLLTREQNELLAGASGTLQPLAGVVIVRDEPSGMSAADGQAAGDFESGLIDGLEKVGTPAVGAELTTTTPSQIPWYRQQAMPSVDDVDDATGRLSLDYELNGYQGTLGVKSTADSRLPNLTTTQPSGT